MARQYLFTETEVALAQDCLMLTDRDGGELSDRLTTVLSSFDTEHIGRVDAETRGIGLSGEDLADLRRAAEEHLLSADKESLSKSELSFLRKLAL